MLDSLAAPTGAARDAWIDRLKTARERVGEAHFINAPGIVGDERCFPDRFGPDDLGGTRLARRMLAHATRTVVGGDLRVIIGDGSDAELARDGALLTCGDGGRDAVIHVDPKLLDLTDALLEAFAMWVARLVLVRGGHDDIDNHDVIATAVALGFGWLVLQGSWVIEHGGHIEGRTTVTWQRRSVSVRTAPGEFAFLYACWARARGVTTTKAIGAGLRDNQRTALEAAMKAPPVDGFVGQPGTPWLLLLARIDVSDVVDDDRYYDDEQDAVDGDRDGDGVDEVELDAAPVFRVADRRSAGPIALGLAASPLLAVAAGLAFGSDVPPVTFFVAACVPIIAGFVVGLRNVVDICSDPDCKAELPAFSSTCPGCRRALAGRIRHADERLAAEEAWRRDRLEPVPTTSAAMPRL